MKGLVVKEKSESSFYGFYKGSIIEIEFYPEDDYYYIQVFDDGGFSYDGSWMEPGATIDDAIQEAISGAMLDEQPNNTEETHER